MTLMETNTTLQAVMTRTVISNGTVFHKGEILPILAINLSDKAIAVTVADENRLAPLPPSSLIIIAAPKKRRRPRKKTHQPRK